MGAALVTERWNLLIVREFAHSRGWVAEGELDARTDQILATPPNANYRHAVRE
jgi:hypothetical protein